MTTREATRQLQRKDLFTNCYPKLIQKYCKLVTQQRAFVPVYIEKVEIWSVVTDASHTDRQQNIVVLSLSKV